MASGRPASYTDEISDIICAKLSEGQSLRTVCRGDDMPCKATIFNWLRTNEAFLDQYTRAKQESADALTDEMLDIADDSTNDYMTKQNEDGSDCDVLNAEHIQRSRLRIETRKWLAAKLKPKKYGERQQLEHSSPDGSMSPDGLTAEERQTRIKVLLAKQ